MMPSTAGLLLLLIAVVTAASSSFAGAACVPEEREALQAFKQGITSDPTNLLASWKPEEELDCCKWGGVRCSNRTGHVLELHLGGGGLNGQISHSLLSLQHLEYLDVSMNSLEGPTGKIPEFLGSFKNLRFLDLSIIQFSGMVPPQLGNLSKLQFLDISTDYGHMYSSDLSWLKQLPLLEYLSMALVNLSMVADWPYVVNMLPSLRVLNLTDCSLTSVNQPLPRLNLTKLEELYLSSNSFAYPVAACWFWNVTSLEYLSLDNMSNNLNMTMVNMRNLCNLTVLSLAFSLSNGTMITELIERLPQCSSNKLQELYLMGNNLIGSLPNFLGHLTGLTILALGGNNITGPLPASIGNFTNLTNLDLSDNHLSGLITEQHFDDLRSLKYIDLSHNKLKITVDSKWLPPFRGLQKAYFQSIPLGPLFPAWLKVQVDILELDISNTSINDRLPDWFANTFSKATYIDLSKNQIYGELPKDMDTMSLETLYIGSNNLTGQIPTSPKNLTKLDISRNSLSGPLPSNFGAPPLSLILLYSNNISGLVPASLCQLYLFAVDLSNNLFEGELPVCIDMSRIEYLLLRNNRFSGNFPLSLRSSTSLLFLDLSWNRFFGTLPQWIGSLNSLQLLRLDHNMFYGHIPGNITSLENLYHLNLAANRISGVIPPNLSNLMYMARWYAVYTHDEPDIFPNIVGEIIVNYKRQELKYHGTVILKLLSIDLSSNYLTGEIPDEITSLDGLVSLNLSQNKLTGVVPDNIGAMLHLESLDLSNNKLIGEIPSSISRLTYLSSLELSNNNLTGAIPSGGQLETLYTQNPSMYDGNAGLCGPPLQRVCPLNNTSDEGNDKKRIEENHSGEMFFYFGLGVGYVVGLWVVFCSLLFHKAWRMAYFALFDKYYDKCYVLVVVNWENFTRKEETIKLPQIN